MNIATKSWQMPRRSFLKGLGTLMALPALEAMLPGATMAAGAVSSSGAPKRLAFVYMPNGMIMEHWTPEVFGSKFALPHILEPLKDFQSDFQVMTGLAQTKARANGDGAGDHARAN